MVLYQISMVLIVYQPTAMRPFVISYVGYLTQEIAVSNQSTIDIILSADAQTLEEFVVVGYGTQRKRDVTAAISTVNAE
ncbi:MAG: hypothetical protein ACI9P5_004897, partial [Saprospiraceae bacterium]